MLGINIGCCGFPKGREQYYKTFKLVEVQQTFYKPMKLETARSWRKSAPTDFEFTLKCWQLITHPPSSPTYKKAGLEKLVVAEAKTKYGCFKPTKEVFEAWETMVAVIRELEAHKILFQCPGSFKPTDENINNMYQFFSTITTKNYKLIWEPRGSAWTLELVSRICRELNLNHCIDPLGKSKSYSNEEIPQKLEGEILYFRLHGIGGYRYKYTVEDLNNLLTICKNVVDDRPIYCMFNNTSMFEDAVAFQKLIVTATTAITR